jgi:Ca2+-binding EF-hand superfamily protein
LKQVSLSQLEERRLFDLFDTDNSGEITLTEFIEGIRGKMAKKRHTFVKQIWYRMSSEAAVSIEALAKYYNASYVGE